MNNNINPEVLKMLDQLAQWRARQFGGYTPQAQQLYGNLGQQAQNILKGNKLLGVAGFVPDMLRLQYGGLTPQEQIQNANLYLQRTNNPARINPDGTWSL